MADETRKIDPDGVALTSGGGSARRVIVGDIIGADYRILGLIGKGGMGYVFRAEHTIIGREYALKMLAPDQINEITWNRFQAEGKAIARLDHINIVKIYNMGVDAGQYPYYVMDLLDGISLADCIEQGLPLSLDDVLDMFIQLSSGFGYAHSRGIIHRDVKPSNVVLIDSGGQYPTAKIVDFGIAKLVGAGNDLSGQSQTATGEIFGSPYYMSPEQCLASQIDHRADIYSLGCTLFEALSGQPPFKGETAMQTVLMHQTKPSPSLESVSGKYWSEEMEAIVAKMLMKKPSERYQTMEQVRHDLERIKQHKAVGKNVETGFDRSVESQLEDIGSRYEDEQASRSLRIKVLVGCGLLILTLAGVTGSFLYRKAVNTPKLDKVAPLFAPPIKVEELREDSSEAPREASARKKLKTTGPIFSEIDKASGRRIFHFPDFSLGTLRWRQGGINIAGVDGDARDDGRAEALNTVVVPADKLILLDIDLNRQKEPYLVPEFLGLIKPNEIGGIKLQVATSFDLSDDPGLIGKRNKHVEEMIEAMSAWKNLQYVEFSNVCADNKVLDALDKHPGINRFLGRSASLDPAHFAEMKFLRRLIALDLFTQEGTDKILCALKGSPNIRYLYLVGCELSATGLIALQSCPNLEVLVLDNCRLQEREILALGKIKSLRRLSIRTHRFDLDKQLPALMHLRDVELMDIDCSQKTALEIERLHKAMPNTDPARHVIVHQAMMQAAEKAAQHDNKAGLKGTPRATLGL